MARKPLSEEHKKNISEALQKNGSNSNSTAQLVIKGLTSTYVRSKKNTVKLRNVRESLKAQIRAIPRGKKGKAAKNKIRAELKKIRSQIREEINKRKSIRKKAREFKRVLSANKRQKKSELRLMKLSKIRQKTQNLLLSAKTSKQRRALKKRLKRLDKAEKKTNSILQTSLETISSGGVKSKKKNKNPLNFNESFEFQLFNEEEYKPFRQLTGQEERVGMEFLNENFNDLQTDLEDELIQITEEELQKRSNFLERVIIANQLSKLLSFEFKLKNKVKDIVFKSMKESLNQGKANAVLELNKAHDESIVREKIPKELNDVIKLEAELIADQYSTELTNELKASISSTKAIGISSALVLNNALNDTKKRSSKLITNISGTVPGKYINTGRRQEFFRNIEKLEGYQRSEVLDKRTCNICMSLDMRTIGPNDPMANMNLVHSHCFTEGNMVLTINGEKDIKDIEIGDIVATHNDNWEEVYHKMSNKYSGELISIELENGKVIECTPNHKFWVNRCWVEAKDITEDMELSPSCV